MRIRDWSFWDWVGYSALFVAALMLALDTAFRQDTNLQSLRPAWTLGRAWGFTPFLLLLIAGLLAVLKHWPRRTAPIGTPSSADAVEGLSQQLAASRAAVAKENEGHNAALGELQVERNRTRLADERTRSVEKSAEKKDAARAVEIAELTYVIEEGGKQIAALNWSANYHVAFPMLRSLERAQLDAMMPFADRCNVAAQAAAYEAEKVLMDLLKQLAFVEAPSKGAYLAYFIDIDILRPMKHTARLLSEQREDPRTALVAFAIRYHIARKWIQNSLAALVDVNGKDSIGVNERFRLAVASILNYPKWFAADSEWFAKLEDAYAIQTLSDVRGEIQNYCEIYGLVRALPPQMNPV